MHRRQVLGPPRDGGAADRPRGGRGDGSRFRRVPQGAGPACLLRRGALLRRLPIGPRLRSSGPGSGRGGRRRASGAVRHERRDAALRHRDDRRRGFAAREHPAGDPRPQRHRVRGRELAHGGGARCLPGAGRRERVWGTHRERRPDPDRRQPHPEDGRGVPSRRRPRAPHGGLALCGRGGERRAGLPAAVLGTVCVHAQGRPARERCRAPHPRVRARRRPRRWATGVASSPATSAARRRSG